MSTLSKALAHADAILDAAKVTLDAIQEDSVEANHLVRSEPGRNIEDAVVKAVQNAARLEDWSDMPGVVN